MKICNHKYYCKHLIFMASKICDFKRQFNFGGFSIYCILKLFSNLTGANLKGKIYSILGSIFFPLIVAPFKTWFSLRLKDTLLFKS